MTRRSSTAFALSCSLLVAACGDDDPIRDRDADLDGDTESDADAAPDAARHAPPYRFLSETGFYADPTTQQRADDLLPFAPTFVLWSDGLRKSRFVRIPAGTAIDATDLDHWQLPVGAQLFKEFRDADGRLIETRLIERIADTGDDDRDFWVGAFVWNEAGSEAEHFEEGMPDVLGTDHDVPKDVQCRTCHGGEAGYALGVSAIQLSGAGEGTRLSDLISRGILDASVAGPFDPPGDAVTRAALGYLHANCGNCHNPNGAARPDVDMTLRLSVAERTAEDTAIYRATVGQALFRFMEEGYTLRIAPGDPDHSALLYRMSIRGTRTQMPPIATEHVDESGLAMVRAWIESL